jgi:hypothetical protein
MRRKKPRREVNAFSSLMLPIDTTFRLSLCVRSMLLLLLT